MLILVGNGVLFVNDFMIFDRSNYKPFLTLGLFLMQEAFCSAAFDLFSANTMSQERCSVSKHQFKNHSMGGARLFLRSVSQLFHSHRFERKIDSRIWRAAFVLPLFGDVTQPLALLPHCSRLFLSRRLWRSSFRVLLQTFMKRFGTGYGNLITAFCSRWFICGKLRNPLHFSSHFKLVIYKNTIYLHDDCVSMLNNTVAFTVQYLVVTGKSVCPFKNWLLYAPVVQWIERWPSKPKMRVRFLPSAPSFA